MQEVSPPGQHGEHPVTSENISTASVLLVLSGENEEEAMVLDDALPVLLDQNEEQAVVEVADARCKIVRPILPGLPALLTAMANLPFPDTELLQKVFQGSHGLDESQVLQYEDDPPYSTPSYPTDTPGEQMCTQKMREVFLGRQLRLRKKLEESRMQRWKEGLTDERHQEFFVLLQKWRVLKRHLETYEGGMREATMAATLLWWRAYLVVKLASEIQGDE